MYLFVISLILSSLRASVVMIANASMLFPRLHFPPNSFSEVPFPQTESKREMSDLSDQTGNSPILDGMKTGDDDVHES